MLAAVLVGWCLVSAAVGHPALQDVFNTIAVGSSDPTSVDSVTAACRAPVELGHCQEVIEMWAFDKRSQLCRQFPWSGCGGSANRFETKADCLARCGPLMDQGSGCPDLNNCPPSCSRRIDTVTNCQQCDCTAPSAGVCALPTVRGLCRGAFEVYGYNIDSGSCELFIYGGCGGNGNRFKTMQECRSVCVAS